MTKTTVSVDQQVVNQVKGAIIGTSFNIGTYYDQAVKEKIEREKAKYKTEPKSY